MNPKAPTGETQQKSRVIASAPLIHIASVLVLDLHDSFNPLLTSKVGRSVLHQSSFFVSTSYRISFAIS
eukprot:15744248-Heterocapsa_arctica.AAC.1